MKQAADLLGVSGDTLRRWADGGRIAVLEDDGPAAIDGAELARFAQELVADQEHAVAGSLTPRSARNSFTGLVTKVVRDTVMAQVEIQAGPHRVVALISREAADELSLEVGVLAVASVKATNVVVEVPRRQP